MVGMIGVIVNTVAVLIGGGIGLLIKKGIPEKLSNAMMGALALITIYIGIKGSLDGENAIVIIISMVSGIIIGELLKLDDHLNNLADRIGRGKSKIAEGFITACLIWCVGALTIVGSLQAGLEGDNEMLFTKSGLDFISSIILAASFGAGVLIASGFVLVFQGGIVLLAHFIAPYLGTDVIAEMTCVGSILIIALGLNLLKITDIKVMNYIPGIFMPIAILPLYNFIISLI